MKNRLLTTTLIFCSIVMTWAQESSFTTIVNMDSVLIGNYIEVTFKADNIANAQIEAPDFIGFETINGPNISSSMQVINGDVTQSVSNTYWLEPKDVGQYYIGSAQVRSGEDIFETQPVEINVYHNPDGIVQKPVQKERENTWFNWPDRQTTPKSPKKQKKKRKTYRM